MEMIESDEFSLLLMLMKFSFFRACASYECFRCITNKLNKQTHEGAKISLPLTLMNRGFSLGKTTSFDFQGHPPN
jgi:hypothetical protein